jgi:hypothetical protein
MVAVAVHELAVLLYKMGDLQQHEDWKTWKPPKRHYETQYSASELQLPEPQSYRTLFSHLAFEEHTQYPEGIADVVGYWAENRILGGVVLFDRGESGNQVSTYLAIIISCSARTLSNKVNVNTVP